MKKTVAAIVIALLLIPMAFLLKEKQSEDNFDGSVNTLPLMSGEKSEAVSFEYIKYGTVPHSGASSSANSISNWFYSNLRMDIEVVSASKDVGKTNLIVYGALDSVPLSVALAEAVEDCGEDTYAWGIAYEDGVLALYANSKIAFSDAEGVFGSLIESLSDFISEKQFLIAEGFSKIESITVSDYSTLVKEKEDMEKQQQVEQIKAKIENEFSYSTFDPNGLGITEDMTVDAGKSYASPLYYPSIGEHPRVLFTADMIPGIRAALDSPEYSAAKNAYESLLKKETDGKLGTVITTSTYSYNFSSDILNSIQAKAFAYAVYGDEYYGYSSVYALLNFMATLDYNFKQIDQTRDFGAIIYTAACVYDWCYDLLSDDVKTEIMLGVEHVACRGYVDEPEKASFDGVKLEIGFPPSKQGAVTGHGCEMMLLRNFLAISIAIYDEHPGWYEFCAGRFFEEYIEPRNVYYSAGMYPQGTQYNTQRFHCDLYSAVLIKAISGTVPYDAIGMRNTVYGLFATVTDVSGKGTFLVGDIRRTNTQILQRAGECAMLASYLFDDAILRGLAQWRESGFSKFSSGSENLTPTEFFVLASNGISVSENGVLDTPSVIYNGGWYGQLSVRESWSDGSVVVLMKVQERTTANHDHAAAGTFQIYYKGMLTGDMGDYAGDVYGSEHCKYFLRSTVSHNGLLIYDPSKQSTKDGYYVGGQRSNLNEASSLASWLANSNYDTGEVLGYSYGYRQSGETEYAYISGDITKAYENDQAGYVGRSMLTVYTGDEDCPMVFFVFDRISSVKAEFTKKFLLQVPSSKAPVIDKNGNTVEVSNGKGKLLLTNIIGADEIVGYGGTDENGNRLNYQINGKQVDFVTQGVVTNRDSWGRVELVQNTGSTLGNFFNVIQVGDDGVDFKCSPVSFAATDKANLTERVFEGVRVGSIAALFVNSEARASVESVFTIPGEGYVTAYIGGLHTGTWRVSADGKYVGTVYSTNDSGMVRFTVPAGVEITLTPTAEIRPANSGEISFVTSGGSFDSAPSRFYPLGEETDLPTDISRGSDIFDGWYTDESFSERIYKVPSDAGARFTVYAKWLSVPFSESFTETELNVTVDSTLAGARYSCDKKANSSFVTDNYRGALVWTAGESGPHITVNGSTLGSTSNLIASLADSKITVSLSLALNGDSTPQDLMIRIRDNGSLGAQKTISVASLSGGVLYLGSGTSATNKLVELSATMKTVNITVDFETLNLVAHDADGKLIAEIPFTLPVELSGKTGLDWKKCFDSELLNIRAQSAGSILVGRITVAEGDGSSIPKDPTADEIIYVTNGGNFKTNPDTSYIPGEEKLLSTDIEKDGYLFLGWYLAPSFDGEPVTSLPVGATGQFPVYARWVAHKIVYVTNGGSFKSSPDTAYTPGTAKPLATDIEKNGYSFGGWYRTPNFSGDAVSEISINDFDTVILYAKWVLSGNIVVYDANGGTLTGVGTLETGENADFYTPGTEYTLVTTVSKTGCEFLGWFTGDGVHLTSFSDKEGAIYVSARWSISFLSEDYSETEINTEGRASANGISYSNDSKSGVSFVTDKEGEFLTFTSSASGPHITATPGANTYANMDSHLLSFTMSFAAQSGTDVMNFRVRFRDKGGCSAGKECDLVVLYCLDGTIYLGSEKQSVKLFDLTTEFTTARIVVDFSTLTLFAYSDSGEVIADVPITVSSYHTSIDGDAWQDMFKGELFNLRSAGAGSVKIGEIIVCEGNIFEK